MTSLRLWITRHPVLAFTLITYGYSWGLWTLMLALWGKINWLGSFGPSIAAVVVVGLTRGRGGLRNLLRPILAWRFGGGWYLFVLPGCVVLLLLGLWLYMLAGGLVSLPAPAVLAWLPLLPVYYLIVFVIGGPLGEEVGWRGFLLPHFLKDKSPLHGSLLLAALWFGWHLPLFWLPGASQQGGDLAAFAIFVAASSVIFTWVYLGTSGSLLSALLLHSSINTFSLFMSETDPLHADAIMWPYSAVLAVFAVILLVASMRMRRPAGTALVEGGAAT